MARNYPKMEPLAEIVKKRKAYGETNHSIAESYELTKKALKQLVSFQKRKERLLAVGYIPQPKGQPRKEELSAEAKTNNEIAKLRMHVELRGNLLLDAGRR